MARIEKSIDVDVPLRAAYTQWTQFEELPRFMEGVKEVRRDEDGRLHWRAEIAGKTKEWTAEIVEQVPDRRISLRSTTDIHLLAQVSFEPLPTGARVSLWMDYDPQGLLESVGDALGATSRRMESDLRRFKELVERRARETGQPGEAHEGTIYRPGEPPVTSSRDAATGTPHELHRPSGKAASPSPATGERRHGERRRAPGSGMPARPRPAPDAMPVPETLASTVAALRRITRDMDELVDRVLSSPESRPASPGSAPQVELFRRGDDLHVEVELAGVHREDVTLDVRDGHLMIEGSRRNEPESDDRYHSRKHGYFCHAIPLPGSAAIGEARATLAEGMLKIVVPLHGNDADGRVAIADDARTSVAVASAGGQLS